MLPRARTPPPTSRLRLLLLLGLLALVGFSALNFHHFAFWSGLWLGAPRAPTTSTPPPTIATTPPTIATSEAGAASFELAVERDAAIPLAQLVQFEDRWNASELSAPPSAPPVATIVLTLDCSLYSDWQVRAAVLCCRRRRSLRRGG